MGRYGVFTVEFFLGFFTILLLLRFLISGGPYERASNLSMATNSLTDWLCAPMRRFIPRAWGLELGALLAAYIIVFAQEAIVLTMHGVKILAQPSLSLPAIFALALIGTFVRLLQLMTAVIIAGVVISWLRMHGPVAVTLKECCARLLYPIRKMVPTVSGLDFSPVIALFIVQIMLLAASDAMHTASSFFR